MAVNEHQNASVSVYRLCLLVFGMIGYILAVAMMIDGLFKGADFYHSLQLLLLDGVLSLACGFAAHKFIFGNNPNKNILIGTIAAGIGAVSSVLMARAFIPMVYSDREWLYVCLFHVFWLDVCVVAYQNRGDYFKRLLLVYGLSIAITLLLWLPQNRVDWIKMYIFFQIHGLMLFMAVSGIYQMLESFSDKQRFLTLGPVICLCAYGIDYAYYAGWVAHVPFRFFVFLMLYSLNLGWFWLSLELWGKITETHAINYRPMAGKHYTKMDVALKYFGTGNYAPLAATFLITVIAASLFAQIMAVLVGFTGLVINQCYWNFHATITFTIIWTVMLYARPQNREDKLTTALLALVAGAFCAPVIIYTCSPLWYREMVDIVFTIVHITMIGTIVICWLLDTALLRWVLAIIGLDIGLAFYFWLANSNHALYIEMYDYWQTLGFATFLYVLLGMKALRPFGFKMRFGVSIITMQIISMVASILFLTVAGNPRNLSHHYFTALLVSSIGGFLLGVYLWWQKFIAAQTQLYKEKLDLVVMENKIAESNLRVLQAQIEPSFLLNTLKDILYMLDKKPQNAKAMQVALIQYLRISLPSIRRNVSPVAQEIVMLTQFLDIFKARLGQRLKYQFILPESLQQIALSPIIIQPVVEFLLFRGLKYSPDEFELIVRGHNHKDKIELEFVHVNGKEIHDNEEVEEIHRIEKCITSIYGKKGRMKIYSDRSGDLIILVSVPHTKPRSLPMTGPETQLKRVAHENR